MADQGVPPEGVKFGDPDHPTTPEAVGERRWQQRRIEVLSQYPALAEKYLEGDDDA